MATASDDAKAWSRLGELLIQRRVDLDPRYRNRQVFSDERHLDYRLCYDVEQAKRTNFGQATLAAIEQSYGLMPGSIRDVLAGGDLSPVSASAASDAPSGEHIVDLGDPAQVTLWNLRGQDGEPVPEFLRRVLISVYRNLMRTDAQEFNRRLAEEERARRRA